MAKEKLCIGSPAYLARAFVSCALPVGFFYILLCLKLYKCLALGTLCPGWVGCCLRMIPMHGTSLSHLEVRCLILEDYSEGSRLFLRLHVFKKIEFC